MPIVEPDVVMDGAHSIAVSAAVTKRVLAQTFAALAMHNVDVEGSQRGELPAMQEADRMLEQFSAYAEQYCDESLRQAILSQIDQARANLARRHSKNDLERDERLK